MLRHFKGTREGGADRKVIARHNCCCCCSMVTCIDSPPECCCCCCNCCCCCCHTLVSSGFLIPVSMGWVPSAVSCCSGQCWGYWGGRPWGKLFSKLGYALGSQLNVVHRVEDKTERTPASSMSPEWAGGRESREGSDGGDGGDDGGRQELLSLCMGDDTACLKCNNDSLDWLTSKHYVAPTLTVGLKIIVMSWWMVQVLTVERRSSNRCVGLLLGERSNKRHVLSTMYILIQVQLHMILLSDNTKPERV